MHERAGVTTRQPSSGTTIDYHLALSITLGATHSGVQKESVMTVNENLWARRAAALPRDLATAMPVFCARAENAGLWDADGKRYIDFAGLATFISDPHGEINGVQLLNPDMLHAAMQQDLQARRLPVASLPHFRYQHDFWARDLQPLLGCAHPTWVPFMSGYGGLSVVLFPNGSVYYNVADDGKLASFDWGKVTGEAGKLGDFCQ